MSRPRLISHHLCPYVQRAVIVAAEKGIGLDRRYISLESKPDWFLALSPTGKVPVLEVGGTALFESAVICEYLDEAFAGPRLHPENPLERARHRAWMEFASAILADIAGLYGAPTAAAFEAKRQALRARFETLEAEITGPWFAGDRFHMVDAFYGSVFRYFDVIDRHIELGLFRGPRKVRAWRQELAVRPSVAAAVTADYDIRLEAFLAGKGSHLGHRVASPAAA